MNLEPNRMPTEIRLEWTSPPTILVIRHTRAMSSDELRLVADIVEHIEAMRAEIKGSA
jgi:hypothetical protein